MSNLVNNKSDRAVCIAPMMAYTDRHYRMLIRMMSQHTWLYTEMVTAAAAIHGDRDKLLGFSSQESPLGLQIAGCDPKQLLLSARIAEDYGYDEVNLNIGCPSQRVQSGQFGACLLKQPELVAQCVHEIKKAVSIPVSVKTRIGVDDLDSYEHLHHFIDSVSQAGCSIFIIHARKAWLKGLSPRQNREIPPLRYDVVYEIKKDFPDLEIIINGGIQSAEEIIHHSKWVDGVMIGRAAYANPLLFRKIDQHFYGRTDVAAPCAVLIIRKYLAYMAEELKKGTSFRQLSRHLLGLFQGERGAKKWRRHLTENAGDDKNGIKAIEEALHFFQVSST